MSTLQRAAWDGHLVSLGNAFEMCKPKGHRELHAVCRLQSHVSGFLLRLEVNACSLSRGSVGRAMKF
jgi:hypothetical protein